LQALRDIMLTAGINFLERGKQVAGFKLPDIRRTNIRKDIQFKVTKNARSMVFAPALIAGMSFEKDCLKSLCPYVFDLTFLLSNF
jgi:hypothetical protein